MPDPASPTTGFALRPIDRIAGAVVAAACLLILFGVLAVCVISAVHRPEELVVLAPILASSVVTLAPIMRGFRNNDRRMGLLSWRDHAILGSAGTVMFGFMAVGPWVAIVSGRATIPGMVLTTFLTLLAVRSALSSGHAWHHVRQGAPYAELRARTKQRLRRCPLCNSRWM